MKLLVIAVLISFLLSSVNQSVLAQENKLADADISSIHVAIDNPKGNYTVVYERMVETGTAGALFGIVGAAVNSSQNNSQDERMADKWRAYAEQMNIGEMVEQALRAKLATADGIELATEADGASHELEIEIKDWGLIRKSQEVTDLRAFLNVNIRMEDRRGRLVWRDYPNRVGKFSSANLDDFSEEVFTAELTKLSKKVGESIAYEIIYR